MSSKINLYRLSGYFIKGKDKIPINFETRASTVENAIEKAFSEIGSRHRVKRDRIFIEKDKGVQIITSDQAKEPEFAEMEQDDFKIFVE
jgi:large subunit ribosomal protein LX